MEGHYTRGIGDGKNSPETPLELLPNAARLREQGWAQAIPT